MVSVIKSKSWSETSSHIPTEIMARPISWREKGRREGGRKGGEREEREGGEREGEREERKVGEREGEREEREREERGREKGRREGGREGRERGRERGRREGRERGRERGRREYDIVTCEVSAVHCTCLVPTLSLDLHTLLRVLTLARARLWVQSPTGGAEFSLSFLSTCHLSSTPFCLYTSLLSALSGVESGARCAITEGPRTVRINQHLSIHTLYKLCYIHTWRQGYCTYTCMICGFRHC